MHLDAIKIARDILRTEAAKLTTDIVEALEISSRKPPLEMAEELIAYTRREFPETALRLAAVNAMLDALDVAEEVPTHG